MKTKAARKIAILSDSEDEDEKPPSDDEQPEQPEPPDASDDDDDAFPNVGPVDAPPTRISTPPPPSGPSEELCIALESLTLTPIRMQGKHRLPFLHRNLQRGFELRCRALGISTEEVDMEISLKFIYNRREGDDVWETSNVTAWCCPLCNLHGSFKTREMLEKHLQWDHCEVGVSWRENVLVNFFYPACLLCSCETTNSLRRLG